MALVLVLATLLANALAIGAAEGDQGAVVGRAGAQVPVLHRLGQLVAVQFAVLLVRPQVLLAIIHHAGQAGLHRLHPAGPEAEVTQDLRLPLAVRIPLPCRAAALSLRLPLRAPWGAHVLFFSSAARPRVWADSGQRVSGDAGQGPWSHQIQLSHLEGSGAQAVLPLPLGPGSCAAQVRRENHA